MSDRLELEPDPTPLEFEVVAVALAEAHLLQAADTERVSAWQLAALQESVDRAPEPPPVVEAGLVP